MASVEYQRALPSTRRPQMLVATAPGGACTDVSLPRHSQQQHYSTHASCVSLLGVCACHEHQIEHLHTRTCNVRRLTRKPAEIHSIALKQVKIVSNRTSLYGCVTSKQCG